MSIICKAVRWLPEKEIKCYALKIEKPIGPETFDDIAKDPHLVCTYTDPKNFQSYLLYDSTTARYEACACINNKHGERTVSRVSEVAYVNKRFLPQY